MSVINQMLKDLDKRSEPHQLQQVPAAVAISASKSSGLPWRWLILLSLLLVAIALMLWSLKASDSERTIASDPQGSAQQAAENMATAGAAPVKMEPGSSVLESHSQEPPVQASNVPGPANASRGTESGVSREPVSESESTTQNATGDGESETSTSPATASVAGEVIAPTLSVKTLSEPSGTGSSSAAMNTSTPAPGSMAVTEVVLTPAEQAERAMVKANAARDAGKLDEAMRQYAMALSYEPARHEARRQLAALHYGQGQAGEAIKLLQRGLAEFPEQSSFALLLGRLWREQGDKQQALAALQSIGDSDTLARDKWLLVADIAREQEDYVLAETAYQKLLSSGMEKAQWWLGLAYAQDAQGKLSDARYHYQRALSTAGLSADARAYIENRLTQLGESQ